MPTAPFFPSWEEKACGTKIRLDFTTQGVHLGQLFLDELPIWVAGFFLPQNHLIGGFDFFLEFLILGPVQCSEILCAFEHHVFQKVGNAGFACFFERRTGPYSQPDRHLGHCRAVDHQKEHAVFQRKCFDIDVCFKVCVGAREPSTLAVNSSIDKVIRSSCRIQLSSNDIILLTAK
jgi:hypothetical protein